MPNMSNVRFENTLSDLRDCRDNLMGKLSASETRARTSLVDLCAEILEELGYDVTEPETASDFTD